MQSNNSKTFKQYLNNETAITMYKPPPKKKSFAVTYKKFKI